MLSGSASVLQARMPQVSLCTDSPATFQMLKSHLWRVVAILDNTEMGCSIIAESSPGSAGLGSKNQTDRTNIPHLYHLGRAVGQQARRNVQNRLLLPTGPPRSP